MRYGVVLGIEKTERDRTKEKWRKKTVALWRFLSAVSIYVYRI